MGILASESGSKLRPKGSSLARACLLFGLFVTCTANHDAKRLYDDLLRKRGYNKLIRPVGNNTDKLTVKLGIRLSQMIDVDEKNQIMTTNVWLRQEWWDVWLQWNPKEYAGLKTLEVPAADIWTPDLVLFNNADGNYEVTLMTKATLHPDGLVVWEPPAIYKSSCTIDVEFFPFDIQLCTMKFGSWTYDGNQVDLVHICAADEEGETVIKRGMDLRELYRSVEWDILDVPAKKNEKRYLCCPEPYPDITFNITMRRKTLFYTVNLIIPCVSISFLTVLVFYLPSDSGEKIALCISILLSLTVFFLLLAEIIPPTSIVVPLIGKYLLFTMILVTLSIIVTVVVLNVHFRSPWTHTMSPWVRRVFLSILPKLLIMRRPNLEFDKSSRTSVRTCNGIEVKDGSSCVGTGGRRDSIGGGGSVGVSAGSKLYQRITRRVVNLDQPPQSCAFGRFPHEDPIVSESSSNMRQRFLNEDIQQAIDGVTFIAEHLKNEDQCGSIQEDWKYVAMVLDRLFLWIFTTACVVGTFGIILQAPTLYDHRDPLELVDPMDNCYRSYTS